MVGLLLIIPAVMDGGNGRARVRREQRCRLACGCAGSCSLWPKQGIVVPALEQLHRRRCQSGAATSSHEALQGPPSRELSRSPSYPRWSDATHRAHAAARARIEGAGREIHTCYVGVGFLWHSDSEVHFTRCLALGGCSGPGLCMTSQLAPPCCDRFLASNPDPHAPRAIRSSLFSPP